MNGKGVIYIFTNPSFPDYVKIGYADNLKERLKQLNRSETIPMAFRAYAKYEVEERLSDKKVHAIIDRINPDLRAKDIFNGKLRKREFYKMSAEDAYKILESIASMIGSANKLIRVNEEGDILISSNVKRRSPFRFCDYNVPVGSILTFVEDENIKVEVLDDRHVRYNGQTTSLSAIVKNIKGTESVQGTLYFSFEGETLTKRRERIERERKR